VQLVRAGGSVGREGCRAPPAVLADCTKLGESREGCSAFPVQAFLGHCWKGWERSLESKDSKSHFDFLCLNLHQNPREKESE